MSGYIWLPAVFRDIDSSRKSFGLRFWWLGGEAHVGHRLYRVRLLVQR